MFQIPNKNSLSQWSPCSFSSRIARNELEITNDATNRAIFTPGRLLRYKESGQPYKYGQVVYCNNDGTVGIVGDDLPEEIADIQYYVAVYGLLPYGGNTNQVLVKTDIAYGNAVWKDLDTNSDWTDVEGETTSVNGNTITIIAPNRGALLQVGLPICFTFNEKDYYYAKITETSANNYTLTYTITYMGPSFSTTSNIKKLFVGGSHLLTQYNIVFDGDWAATATPTLVQSQRLTYINWGGSKSYLVGMQVRCINSYSSGGAINAIVDGNAVFNNDVTPVSENWTFATTPNPSNYVVNNNSQIEISTTEGSGNGSDLTVGLLLVSEKIIEPLTGSAEPITGGDDNDF